MNFPCILLHPEGNKRITCVAPNVTSDGRTWYGVKWTEIRRHASVWWDGDGRREFWRVKGDLVHQDTGVDSAILRGEKWAQLNKRERGQVIGVYEEIHTRRVPEHAEMLREFMVYNFPEQLDQEELIKHLAAGPDSERLTDTLLEGKLYER